MTVALRVMVPAGFGPQSTGTGKSRVKKKRVSAGVRNFVEGSLFMGRRLPLKAVRRQGMDGWGGAQ